MSYLILSINAGSSSLKTSLYQASPETKKLQRLANAEISNISQPPSKLKYERAGHKDERELEDVKDHRQAFEHVLDAFLSDSDVPEAKNKEDIRYACHRVVHGGDFVEDQLITKETFHKIEQLSDLAPLHNASALSLITACGEHMPKVTNVACFDSVFHQSMPQHVKSYMIDPKIAKSKGLRKYGFHGLSYDYITRAVAQYLQKPTSDTSIIALHLGSGASACAIRDGKSVDTSMGLTPVSGLPGGTRSGDIDPSLIFHYTAEASKLTPGSGTNDLLHISRAEEILNEQSGWKALTGTSDFAEIATSSSSSDMHKLALDIFVDRIISFVGSYYVKLGGQVDALVFAGGVGEKSALLRSRVTESVACLGFLLDSDKNEDGTKKNRGSNNNDDDGGDNDNNKNDSRNVTDITHRDAKHKVLICETDEDYQMAFNTMQRQK